MKLLDLDYFVGDTRTLRMFLRDPLTNKAADLTDLDDAWFTMKAGQSDPMSAAIMRKRLNAGISVIDATGATTGGEESVIDIFPTAAEAALLVAGRQYFFDLRLQIGGEVETDAWGYVNARLPITDDLS